MIGSSLARPPTLLRPTNYPRVLEASNTEVFAKGAARLLRSLASTAHVSIIWHRQRNGRVGASMTTVRSIVLAWVLTLAAAMLISGSLYWLLSPLF
jgi:inorganic phosphate transporter, PiT family